MLHNINYGYGRAQVELDNYIAHTLHLYNIFYHIIRTEHHHHSLSHSIQT